MTKPTYKPIKFSEERWLEIKALRDTLAKERANDNLSLPDVVNEAVKFYSENRNNPYIGKAKS